MLACARLGAVHSVVFGGFAANELASRIEDAQPKVVVSASCGIEPGRTRRVQAAARRGDRAGRQSKPERCIVLQRPQLEAELVPGRDVEWNDAVARRRAGGLRRRRRRPTRSTSSTRRARPGSRRESCATTAATRSRSRGR